MSSLITSKTVVPSYLKNFETEFHQLNLIYAKKPSVASNHGGGSPIKTESVRDYFIKEEIVEDCDLTGDPLKVDLGDDDIINITNVEQATPFWSSEETKHFSLSVKEARRELNEILKNPKPDPSNMPTYVVCNGDDPRKTILLGAEKESLMACGVHAMGFIELKDDDIETDQMVNDHYQNCNRKDLEINYLVKLKFIVYGNTLRGLSCQNASMRYLEKHACVSVDVTSHQRIFKVLEDTKVNMIMNLEITAGHRLLRLNFLWEELRTLQTYIDILSSRDSSFNEDTVLCDEPLDSDIILQRISSMVTTKFLRSPPKEDAIDLDNLRQEDFLDGLWYLLKQCETTSVLRNSFHFLFEELANGNIQVLNIKDKHSSISFIINGILNKNIDFSVITLPQCVELLFELGAQKLKFDFQVILDHFYNTAKNNIESVWKTFYQSQEKKTQSAVRTTRVTQFLNTSNLILKSSQLAYLSQLYVASEFIFLIKEQIYLQEENFYSFCQHVVRQYVENTNIFEDFLEIYQSPLCETSFTFDVTNIDIIKSVSPSRWTMYMISDVGSRQVTTIYDLSKYPVFPPVIYNYDDPVMNKNVVYYMSKMNRVKELC